MNELKRCVRCGALLPDGIAAGDCPRCLFEQALESTSGAGQPSAAADVVLAASIGRYKILRLIGEGGMGIVYEAEQEHPRRSVALKIIKPGMVRAETIRRFEEEAQALGRLQHPGIAQIYEAGTADTGFGPQPYFAMELIQGLMPRDYVSRHNLNTARRLDLVARMAEAVHHAHQRGLIHRDLKPSNILVDESGQPKVLDFGVARAIDSESQATRKTNAGQLIGTLAYMSPEQVEADPDEIDTRSDVYSLGVICYELLAGQLPYSTNRKLPEALRAIREEDPAPLGSRDRGYRGDIETIVAKALEKDKTRRYSSAAELAADIRRFLADQPIVARPPTASYQLKKFARRNRALVAGVASIFLVLVLGMVASLWQARRAAQAEQAAVKERDHARQAEAAALAAEAMAREEQNRATSAEQAALIQRNAAAEAEQLALKERDRAFRAETQVRQDRDRITWQNLSRESMRLATSRTDDDLAALLARQAFLLQQREADSFHSTLVESALQQAGRATFWSHNIQRVDGTNMSVVAFSPDGSLLATNASDGGMALWDLRRPGSLPRHLPGERGLGPALFGVFSPDGTLLATGGFANAGLRGNPAPAPVKIWDLRTPNNAPMFLEGHRLPLRDGAFSPDGKYLATADTQTLRLWDLRDPAKSRILGRASSVAFSPDGTLLAAAGDGAIRIWSLRNLDAPPTFFQPDVGNLGGLEFSPDGKHLAGSGREGARMWELQDPGPPRVLVQVQGNALAFSHDGTQLATGGTDRVVRLWNLGNSSAPPVLLRGHEGSVQSVAFSVDGSLLASASIDNTVRVWELKAAAPTVLQASVSGGRFGRSQVAFSADGARLYSGVARGAVQVWTLKNPSAAETLQGTEIPDARSIAIAPGGERAVVGGTDGITRVYDLRGASTVPLVLPMGDILTALTNTSVSSLGFSQTAEHLALGILGSDTVWVWDLRTLSTVPLPVPGAGGIATAVALSPDGSKLATGNQLDVRLWDLRRPGSAPVPLGQGSDPRQVETLEFSSDGNRLAVGMQDVHVWNLNDLKAEPLTFRGFPGYGFYALDFSPDGKSLAGGNLNRVTQLWDLRNPNTPPTSFPGSGNSVTFSPDGRHLAIAGSDSRVRVWAVGAAAADYLCTRVWRNLSMAEWRQYVGEGFPYERTCPALPAGAGAPGAP